MFKTKAKIFFSFFDPLVGIFFSTLPSTQTIKVIGLISFSLSWPWKIGLWICISTLYLFSMPFSGGGSHASPGYRFRPPSLYRVKPSRVGLIFENVIVPFFEHFISYFTSFTYTKCFLEAKLLKKRKNCCGRSLSILL